MIAVIRNFFERKISPETGIDPPGSEHRLQLATAALLIEVLRADLRVTDEERDAVVGAMQAKFGLDKAETEELVALAEEEGRSSPSYFEFTSLINSNFTLPQKIRIVEFMWRVAFADGALDKYEEHLVRRIAGLLHVPHKEFIDAKLRVRDERCA